MIKQIIAQAIGFAGVGALSYGCWLWFPPSGFIAGGACLIALAFLAQRVND